eukprot:6034945-Alexandrium_andersonii.AAC.1
MEGTSTSTHAHALKAHRTRPIHLFDATHHTRRGQARATTPGTLHEHRGSRGMGVRSGASRRHTEH